MRAVFGFAVTLLLSIVAALSGSAARSASVASARAASAARVAATGRAGATGRLGATGRATAWRRAVFVWLPYWSMSAGYSSAIANAATIGSASPFWYTMAGDSTIQANAGVGAPAIIDGLRARGIQVVPMVTETDGMRAFDRVLASPSQRAAMVHALVTIAGHPGYAGLDLDFEEFAVDHAHVAGPANEAAARYAAFVGEACGALHAIGRRCLVTVMPRTSGAHVYWRGKLATWVYDYGALAAVADRVQVMAYDEHAPGTAPGPVSPISWVEQVIGYARATMPGAKVDLALPAYGYDFSGRDATSVTAQQAAALAAQRGTSPTWDAAGAEETFRYRLGRRLHTVWYEDGRADYIRARLARAAGFAGIDLWSAGGEDPSVWPLLRGLFGG